MSERAANAPASVDIAWSRATIEVSTEAGLRNIDGWRAGCFAVHTEGCVGVAGSFDDWCVTHLPTGNRMGSVVFATDGDARRFAEALLAQPVDWLALTYDLSRDPELVAPFRAAFDAARETAAVDGRDSMLGSRGAIRPSGPMNGYSGDPIGTPKGRA